MSHPTPDTPDIWAALRKAHYLKMVEAITAPPAFNASARPPTAPDGDIIGQLAVAALLKQGEAFEMPLTRKGDFSLPPVQAPHIIVRRSSTRWPGGPLSRFLVVPKEPEGTLIFRLVADLRKCERLDALDAARWRLAQVLRRRANEA